MFKYLSKHCESIQQVDKLSRFLTEQDFDTESVKMDTQNMVQSNLYGISFASHESKAMTDFLASEAGMCCLS